MKTSFEFANPWLLLLLLLLPALAWLHGQRGAAPAVIYSSLQSLKSLGLIRRSRSGAILLLFTLMALACMIVALARPRLSKALSNVQASGVDILLTIDVSRSMLAQDFTIGGVPSDRLEAVKKVTREFIEGRPHDRIGMVCFAGRPYLVSPLTLNHTWLLDNLERVRIGLVEDGTAIGSALASAASRLKEQKSKSRIVVLLTDGANNAGSITPATAAEAAAALGIKIYTIGAGSKGYAPIPVPIGPGGATVMQRIKVDVDEPTLQKVAEIGGGQYFRATDLESLEGIYNKIDEMEKVPIQLTEYREHKELFAWALIPGLCILSLQFALSQTLWRRVP